MSHIDFCQQCNRDTQHDDSGKCTDRLHDWLQEPESAPKPIAETKQEASLPAGPEITGSSLEGILAGFVIVAVVTGLTVLLWYFLAPHVEWLMLGPKPSAAECERYLREYPDRLHS